MQGAEGKVKRIRLADSAFRDAFGLPTDELRTQVVVELQGSDKYFGLDVKPGPDLPSRLAMLAILREAFFADISVGISFECPPGKRASRIYRVELLKK